MTSRAFVRFIQREDITVSEIIDALGVTCVDMYKWCHGIESIPPWVTISLGYMAINLILGNPAGQGIQELITKNHIKERYKGVNNV